MASEETPVSPSIGEEEDEDDDEQSLVLKKHGSSQSNEAQKSTDPESSPELAQDESVGVSTPHAPINGLGDARAKRDNPTATTRELEQMKVKYKAMERKRMEDRDKIKALDTLKAERDKFETTMQKLQRKCQAQSQEMADWRRQLQESEAKVEEIERADAERGTEVEMATLDKEMVEERFQAATAELEILKERFEELELEAEIMRDENKELSSGMTSEERSSAGWLQMEKENQRLRDALVALRDMTQESEAGLKSYVKELKEDLSGFEALRSEHEKTKSDLVASQVAVQTLKENIDAANDQEVLVSQLNEEKDALRDQVNSLSKEVLALKEDVDVSRQLHDAQDEAERLLQEDLDDVRALARDRHQNTKHQAKKIDDLEHTLSKFKEVVNGLQGDLEELQANKELNETETNELNTRSRAMMDLNLRLQSTAAKAQTKKIESEVDQIRAEDTALHLAIIQNFVPESFKDERDPILALLRFKRICSKAILLRKSVQDDIDHASDIALTDPFTAFEMVEKLQWVSSWCSRSYTFMKGCNAADFVKFDAALHELEPVERSLDIMIDSAKRRDIDCARGAQDLQRMIALLSDLAEKTVTPSAETLTDTVICRSEMMQVYAEVVGYQLELINEFVRNKITLDEDEGMPSFGHKVGALVDRSRTSLVVAGKVLRAIDEKRCHSMKLGEASFILFEQAESIGKDLSDLTRILGQGLLAMFREEDASVEPFKFHDILTSLQESARDWLKLSSSKISEATDTLEIVSEMLSALHSKLDAQFNLASDLSNFSEVERYPAPWTMRAKAFRERKIVDPQMEEKLRKLQLEAREQNAAINVKDKTIEEQSLKMELLEARSKGAKDHATALMILEKELAETAAERDKAVSELEDLLKEKQALAQRHDEASAKLATLNQGVVSGDPATAASLASTDKSRSLQFLQETEVLKEEITNLQSAVRFLKAENHHLLFPVSAASLAATNHAWLEASPLPKPNRVVNDRFSAVAGEARDVFSRLLEVSSALKPLQLPSPSDVNVGGRQSSWRPIKKTPRYLVSQQREEFEKWVEWRDDLAHRTVHGQRRKIATRVGRPSEKSEPPATPTGRRVIDGVEIVGSTP